MHRLHPIRILEFFLAIMLAVLSGSVFLNVVLRFGFNSGITATEEASRILLVWLVMIGTVVVLYDRKHISMNMFVNKLPTGLRRIVAIVGLGLMIFCDLLLLMGAYKQYGFSKFDSFPVTGWPTTMIYLPGITAAVLFAIISGWRLVLLVTGRLTVDDHFAPESEILD